MEGSTRGRGGVVFTETTRVQQCGCGAGFEQQGWGVGDHFIWWPHACSACLTHELQRQEEAFRAEDTVLARRRALALVRVPEKYRAASLENFRLHGSKAAQAIQTTLLAWTRQYLTNWPRVAQFVVFQGAYQTGKTHIAWAVLQALAHRGVKGRLVTVADLVRDLRESWRSKDGPSEAQRLHHYRRHELLVLDELSAHNLSAKDIRAHLYDVIAHRINESHPTIVITNESDSALVALLGGALQRRLENEGGVVEFGTTSWRHDGSGTGS